MLIKAVILSFVISIIDTTFYLYKSEIKYVWQQNTNGAKSISPF